jgi:hypothetical protein
MAGVADVLASDGPAGLVGGVVRDVIALCGGGLKNFDE